MEPQFVVERDCSALGGLFQIIINDMKSGTGNWDDFVVKATKFHTQLKATISASTAFLDAFQKIADMATSTRGGTKEIGTALTRMCLRHRSVEARLKTFTSSIMDCLVLPLQDRIEEWKKTCAQLDKEHSKEYKRLRQELKKKNTLEPSQALYASTSNTLRFKKHARNKMRMDSTNNYNSLNSMSRSMDSMEANEKLFIFEEMEKKAVRRALIEERSHFCLFVNFLRPVFEEEIAMVQETTHLQEILDSLCKLTADPYSLPSASELVISDLRLSTSDTVAFSLQTPPSSPSSFGSRKSSMCSISSFNSSSSGSHSPSHHCRYRSLSQPSVGAGPVFRHTSISSQDSGFMSQDYNVVHYAQLPLMYTSAKYVNHFQNNEVSSLSEHSSGSTSSTSSIPASNKRNDFNLRSHSISTFDRNQNLSKSHDSYSLNIINTSEENLVSVLNTQNNHNNSSTIVLQTPNNQSIADKPDLPSRSLLPDKPSIPTKPYTFNCDTNQRQTQSDISLYTESHPIYANSLELMNDDANVAYSEGSITPTNAERSNSPTNELLSQSKNSSLSASTLTITARSSKPPPPPPVRRTSTLSNPNAITIGTLKTCGVNTYEEIRNLNKTYSTYEDINSLTLSLQNLSSIDRSNQPIYSRASDVIYCNTSHLTSNSASHLSQNKTSEYHSTKTLYESLPIREVQQQQQLQQHMQPVYTNEEQSNSMTLPAPPPEAFSDTEINNHSHHYNKITNVHRQFLETLNNKLGQFKPESHISPRLVKRRSVSLTHNREDEWNSDGAVSNRNTPQPQSIQQTLMSFMTGNHSRSSSTSSNSSARHRRQSPEAGRKKASFTLASCDRESLMASLNHRLAQRQQNEIAKAAATNAMQRKQSVPDVSALTAQYQNHFHNNQISASALNLANVPQSAVQYQSIGQQPQPQPQQQQQIYGPVLHQQQLQRRSSQPSMGLKIMNTTARQPTYESINDKQTARPLITTNASGEPNERHSLPQPMVQSFSNEYYVRQTKNTMPSDVSNKSAYNSKQITYEDQTPNPTPNRLATNESFEGAIAARVNSWFNSVHLPQDVKLCRESLMDQIRRGKPLRKVSASNDRSAPKMT